MAQPTILVALSRITVINSIKKGRTLREKVRPILIIMYDSNYTLVITPRHPHIRTASSVKNTQRIHHP